jgi:prevent-host-death family protein
LSTTAGTIAQGSGWQVWLDYQSEKRHNRGMEAGVRDLRDHLSRYLDAVRDGHQITVTAHGKAVARLVPLDEPRPIDRLIAEGLATQAVSMKRPRTRPTIPADGTVSDLVAEQRR